MTPRPVELVDDERIGRFRVQRWRGPAQALHDLPWPDPLVPTVWRLEVDRAALVLGSTQARSIESSVVDAGELAAAHIEVAVRRSGGGSVLVEPGNGVWLDVLVPVGDPTWDEDVSRSFRWLGQAWADGLVELGVAAQVHPGPPRHRRAGAQVCFAGLGSGEVTVGESKSVGLSQRRTRAGARFQSICYRRWHPGPLAAVGVDPSRIPVPTCVDRPPDQLAQAVLAAVGRC